MPVRLAFVSSIVSTAVLCVQIALVYRILSNQPAREDRPPAAGESERLFLVMFDEALADQSGGVSGHCGLTRLGSGDHGGLQLGVLGGHLAAGLDGGSGGKERIFGCFLSGFGLTDLSECHGW
jgi:hypothetical protein